MIEYSVTSRYYHINEDPQITQIDLTVLNLPFTTTTVRRGEQNCPELLSQRVYNNPNYWWVICQFNGILDPSLMPIGLEVKCPIITRAPREGL